MSDPTKKVSRVFMLRHVERDKKNTVDPQTPTPGGEIVAYAMGMILRKQYNVILEGVISSPQPRAFRTAEIVQSGINGFDSQIYCWKVETDDRLNDFSSDQRFTAEVEAIKSLARKTGLEAEQAIFVSEAARPMLEIKATEYMAVVDECGQKPGDHLVTVHGAAIDGACLELRQRLEPNLLFGMGSNGGMFDKVEGYCATFVDGILTTVELIRQPAYLRALTVVQP